MHQDMHPNKFYIGAAHKKNLKNLKLFVGSMFYIIETVLKKEKAVDAYR